MKLRHINNLYRLTNRLTGMSNQRKNDFHVNYKCKFENIPSKLCISNENVMIKQRQSSEIFRLKDIVGINYKVKWWAIEVGIKTKQITYKCHFPSVSKARACYERLIYEKVRLQKK